MSLLMRREHLVLLYTTRTAMFYINDYHHGQVSVIGKLLKLHQP